jgi:hypothetical protein
MTNVLRKLEKACFKRNWKSLGDDAPRLTFRGGPKMRCLTGEMSREPLSISQNFQLDELSGVVIAIYEDFRGLVTPNPDENDTITLHEPGENDVALRVTRTRRNRASSIVVMQTVKDHS